MTQLDGRRNRGIVVTGTASDAGKSVIAAGICRWLRRRGVRVAPFKAQNMSNNSSVAIDAAGRAGEFGRAQAMQAAACGVAPDTRFNPILLKPEDDNRSQLILLGQAAGHVDGSHFRGPRPELRRLVHDTLAELLDEYDAVVCEGAGSPAEINLRDADLSNLDLARFASLPAILVGDIDRGGVFASFYGTFALLEPADQAVLSAFVINKFRGDPTLLQPAIDRLTQLTGRPTLGAIPWHLDIWLDAEDSVTYGRPLGRPRPPHGTEWLRVAVIRLPRISNATDAEALATEPGVQVRLTIEPAELAGADLIVLPGTKSTVHDLEWLRRTGLAESILAHAHAGRPLIGICGGFQMLAGKLHDDVESHRGTVAGLGLLPVHIAFAADKTVTRTTGTAFGGVPVHGYEIHHGFVPKTSAGLAPFIRLPDGSPEGAISERGNIFGTHWHGIFESDAFRRTFLTRAAHLAGRTGFTVAPNTEFAAAREHSLDLLADLVEQHLDTNSLWRLIDNGWSAAGPGHGSLDVATPSSRRQPGGCRDRLQSRPSTPSLPPVRSPHRPGYQPEHGG
jgi:adenosylcobyric acid synthase